MFYAKSTSFAAPFCMNFAKCVHTALKTLLLLVTEWTVTIYSVYSCELNRQFCENMVHFIVCETVDKG